MEKVTSILAVADAVGPGLLALDKSVALARAFGARVDLLVSGRCGMGEFAEHCARRAYADVTLCSVDGEQLDRLILRQVTLRRPDLVVKPAAGAHPLRRGLLDPGDWLLADECPVPLLLVGPRRWSRQLRIAAAVDISDADTAVVARGILHIAGFLALGCHGSLDVLYSERETRDETIRMERAVKLAQLVREYHVGCEQLQMLNGDPETKLPPLIAARDYDLLVLGAVSHRDIRPWSTTLTSRLVEASPGDVVLVKGAAASIGEQHPDLCEQLV